MELNDIVLDKIKAIETEMKKVGAWTNKPFDEKLLVNMGPFGTRTMPFEYWLQFVFILRVKESVKNNGKFPPKSFVGTQAIREFDGRDEYTGLINLLCEFDALFNNNSYKKYYWQE